MQVHVEGTELVVHEGTTVTREPIDGVDAGAAAALRRQRYSGLGCSGRERSQSFVEFP